MECNLLAVHRSSWGCNPMDIDIVTLIAITQQHNTPNVGTLDNRK
jgi:hypothetical protein